MADAIGVDPTMAYVGQEFIVCFGDTVEDDDTYDRMWDLLEEWQAARAVRTGN